MITFAYQYNGKTVDINSVSPEQRDYLLKLTFPVESFVKDLVCTKDEEDSFAEITVYGSPGKFHYSITKFCCATFQTEIMSSLSPQLKLVFR